MPFDVVIGRTKKEVDKYGTRGSIFIGKQYVQMGAMTSLSNNVHMDVARSHVVFVCGKRGGGKCVVGSVDVRLADGTKTIREVYEELEKDAQVIKKTENEELLRPRKKVEVLSLGDDFTVVKKPISFIYKKRINEKVIKIMTLSGKEIVVTKEHPLLLYVEVVEDDSCTVQCSWQRADAIRVGDFVTGFDGSVSKEKISMVERAHYEGWVYDFTIPETHNFIGNSLVCHNSYSMGVIAEGIIDLPVEIKQNLSVIMLDTMGVFWTMKYPNQQDAGLLHEWGLEPKGLDVRIFTPTGFYDLYKEKGIPTDAPFAIRPADLNPEDWCLTFGLDINSPAGVLIARVVHALIDQEKEFGISDMIKVTEQDEKSDEHTKNVVANQFHRVEDWGIFSKKGTPLKALAVAGQVTVLDMSPYATLPNGWLIKSLVIGLVSKNIFTERMIARKNEEFASIDAAMHYFAKEMKERLEEPLVWLVVDEAHEMLPNEGKTTATDALVTILREGRQPGISLILASQQPGKIHTDVITQSDIVISHRLTAQMDVDALGQLMQTYMREGLSQKLDALPRVNGSAIVFDDLNERIFPVQIRPRFSWHGGSAPTAMIEKPELVFKAGL